MFYLWESHDTLIINHIYRTDVDIKAMNKLRKKQYPLVVELLSRMHTNTNAGSTYIV